jgi:aldose 1-epimerase
MDSAADQLTRAPSGTQWTIVADGQEAVVVEVGGGLRAYRAGGADLVDGYADSEICPGGAGQVLAPWPNRIRDGRYTFRDVTYQLPVTEPANFAALHGLVNWVRWRGVESAPDKVVVEHELVPQPGYPWSPLLRTTWRLAADGLTATHEVTNLGGDPLPFGMGVHPYLLVAGRRVDDLSLLLPAHSRLLVDSRMLPIGAARVAGTGYDFTAARRIGPLVLDSAFGDVAPDADGRITARLAGPDGAGVEIWADRAFRWWQVFTGDTLPAPRRRRSVALEPMTCPPDAFRSGKDLIVLEPGETWRGDWGLRPLAVG